MRVTVYTTSFSVHRLPVCRLVYEKLDAKGCCYICRRRDDEVSARVAVNVISEATKMARDDLMEMGQRGDEWMMNGGENLKWARKDQIRV